MDKKIMWIIATLGIAGLFFLKKAGEIPITEPGVLRKKGATYVLQNDIETSYVGFTIEADNITLDLNNHFIKGGMGDGIFCDGYNNLTIKNGEINNFKKGIHLRNNENNNIINIVSLNNFNGIYLDSSSNNTIQDSTFNLNDYGIIFLASNSNNLTNVIVNDNISMGITLDNGSSNNTLTNITANSNVGAAFFGFGIYIRNSNNNQLTDITTNSNNRGIYLQSSLNNTFKSCVSCDNTNDFFCKDSPDNYDEGGNVFDLNDGCGWLVKAGAC